MIVDTSGNPIDLATLYDSSHLEYEFANIWEKTHSEIILVSQHKPIPKRQFMLDFAHPSTMIAVEIHGGVYSNGRHVRPKGFSKDQEKFFLMAERGWSLFPMVPDMIHRDMIARIARFIKAHLI
jgi:very-short-patch-repair endonuclease